MQVFDTSDIRLDPASLQIYAKDWTTYYQPKASAVVFPRESAQIEDLVRLCQKNRWKLVPSGGRTGLSGGAVAKDAEIVLSFEKMNKILDFYEGDAQIRCQAGVVTQVIQDFASEKGLFYPVDFSSSGSSMIGGNIATNAGGIRVLKYGNTRNWVTGLEVVTGQPKRLQLNNGLLKNATGYDFRHLFIGSEGSLGAITEAQLQLTRRPLSQTVALLAVASWEDILEIFKLAKKSIDLSAFEVISELAIEKLCSASKIPKPLQTNPKLYLLMETESYQSESTPALESFLDEILTHELASDGSLSQNSQQAAELWSYRENISESLAPYKPYKNDVAVRPSQIPSFVRDLEQLVKERYGGLEVVWFGHVGDGNLHVNILKPDSYSIEEFVELCRKLDSEHFKIISKYRGSISAEHGVGLSKRDFLHFSRSSEEIQYMREIKKIFDPFEIFNPGKIF
ncbi:MAG: FAD-binding oxidoreductase [Bradymonadales bacterium]|nr:MAG: FAD-binding oxidoreductase [Bradymonadales bacterium]